MESAPALLRVSVEAVQVQAVWLLPVLDWLPIRAPCEAPVRAMFPSRVQPSIRIRQIWTLAPELPAAMRTAYRLDPAAVKVEGERLKVQRRNATSRQSRPERM